MLNVKRRPGWITGLCVLIWLQAAMLIYLGFVLFEPLEQAVDAGTALQLGFMGGRWSMIAYGVFLALSGVGVWLMQRWGVICLLLTGMVFVAPVALSSLGAIGQVGEISVVIATLGMTCMPLLFAGLILVALWRAM